MNMPTIEELQKRIAELEAEVKDLRALVAPPPDETPEQRITRILRLSELEHPAMVAAWDKAMAEMGIPQVEPIGAERLQEMMRAEGVDPEKNEFSRGIIEMREE
jgi:hypothetical protein